MADGHSAYDPDRLPWLADSRRARAAGFNALVLWALFARGAPGSYGGDEAESPTGFRPAHPSGRDGPAAQPVYGLVPRRPGAGARGQAGRRPAPVASQKGAPKRAVSGCQGEPHPRASRGPEGAGGKKPPARRPSRSAVACGVPPGVWRMVRVAPSQPAPCQARLGADREFFRESPAAVVARAREAHGRHLPLQAGRLRSALRRIVPALLASAKLRRRRPARRERGRDSARPRL